MESADGEPPTLQEEGHNPLDLPGPWMIAAEDDSKRDSRTKVNASFPLQRAEPARQASPASPPSWGDTDPYLCWSTSPASTAEAPGTERSLSLS